MGYFVSTTAILNALAFGLHYTSYLFHSTFIDKACICVTDRLCLNNSHSIKYWHEGSYHAKLLVSTKMWSMYSSTTVEEYETP